MEQRPAPTPRIRGRRWQRIRVAFLRAHPLCSACAVKGRSEAAVQVDHRRPLSQGGTDEWSNYDGLCRPCHAEKTARDFGHKVRVAIGANGLPLDGSWGEGSTSPTKSLETARAASRSGPCSSGAKK